MAQEKMTELRVGLFVFLGAVLAMIIIFMIGGQREFFERQYELYAQFDSVSGLRNGAVVQLGGVRVGVVDGITFAKDLTDQKLTVKMRIQKKFQDRIRVDSTATINTQGLLGDKFIYVTLGNQFEPVLENGAFIRTAEPSSLVSLVEEADKVMRDVGKVARQVGDMLEPASKGKPEGDLYAAIRSVRQTIEQVQRGRGLAHSLVYDPNGGTIVANIEASTDDLKVVMNSIREGEGTLGLLARDPALYNDLKTLLGRADRNKLMKAVIRSMLRENDRQVLKYSE